MLTLVRPRLWVGMPGRLGGDSDVDIDDNDDAGSENEVEGVVTNAMICLSLTSAASSSLIMLASI